MPEDPQQSKYSFVPNSAPSGDSVSMPEDLQQQSQSGSIPSGDVLEGVVYSRQRRAESLERFRKKRKLGVIPELPSRRSSPDDDVHPPPPPPPADFAPVTAAPPDRLIVDEMEADEDDEEMAYPCPYCYVEYELLPLCNHLEDDHYDEVFETVCTICADRVTGDMLRHITTEHEPLLKMAIQQDKLQKISNPRSQELSLLARDLRETHLNAHRADKGQQSSSGGMTDPLLSSLVLNYPAPGAEEISKLVTSCAEESSTKSEPAQPIWQSSLDLSLSSEEREERTRQAAGKAAFVQDLVCSTMFLD